MEFVTWMVEEETIEEKRKVEDGETEEFQILSDEKEDTQKADEEFLVRPSGCSSLCLKLWKSKINVYRALYFECYDHSYATVCDSSQT